MSRITLQILGTTAGVPTPERAHTAIHLKYDSAREFTALIDCGEGTQRQMMKASLNMMKLDHVFITHWHGDHCLGLPGLIDTMGFEGRERPLNIYAPEVKWMHKCIGLVYPMGKFRVIGHNLPSRGRKRSLVMEEEEFKILSIPVQHSIPTIAYVFIEKEKKKINLDKAKEAGFPERGDFYRDLKEKGKVTFDGKEISFDEVAEVKKGKKIVYSGDTEICDNLREIVEDADLLIQDCTYFEDPGSERPHRHASLPEVIKLASEAKVKKTLLTHISRKYQDMEVLKDLVKNEEGLEVAADFTKVVL